MAKTSSLVRGQQIVGAIWLVVIFLVSTAAWAKTPLRTVMKAEAGNSPPVKILTNDEKLVVIDNGLVNVTIAKPGGDVIVIQYNGLPNVLEIVNEEDNRGYWDLVWNKVGQKGITVDKLQTTTVTVVREDENLVELSCTKKWEPSLGDVVPLNVDKRYIIRRGYPGIYAYAVLERLKGWPDVDMDQIRIVFKLQKAKFHYMAVSDERQRVMPMPEDRVTGEPLAYPEAVLLTKPVNPELKGEVDDKYQYSCETRNNFLHGWISEDPATGFWIITASSESRCGGPMKQELTSHTGPTVLNMFTSCHYAGKDMNTAYRNGEPWKKVFGPFYVYLNSVATKGDTKSLWDDAKKQLEAESKEWPYNFLESPDVPPAAQRGTVTGQMQVNDRFAKEKSVPAANAFVGLALPGEVGSWQTEVKGYQFWTEADAEGQFVIPNVRPGDYNLYAYVPGFIGDFKLEEKITVEPGANIKLKPLVFEPPRNGPTLWEIGIPDRSANEFFVPDADPGLSNKLYTKLPKDKFRQYGLWQRYSELFKEDLIFTVGVSDYTKDWFFAHVCRDSGNKNYVPTTWQIVFQLDNVQPNANYKLQMALASASATEIKINFNKMEKPVFSTGLVGRDNALARHGIHGLYKLFSIDVPSNALVQGQNIIYLTHTRTLGPFYSVMYDYIRLEGPDAV